MAYTYDFFSKQLIGSDKINLSDVFTSVQGDARQALNVSYGLSDIVVYLQDVTQDFKRTERQYIDLDNAIQSIVFKYYESKNQSNPFKSNTTGVVQVDQGPREAVSIKEGKSKGKGKARSIFKKDEEVAVVEPEIVAPAVLPVAETLDQSQEEKTLRDLIKDMEAEGLSDDPDVISEIADQVMITFGYGREEEAKKWFEQNGFDYDKYNQ